MCKSGPSANGPQSSLSPSALTLHLASRQVEHETRIARVSTDDLPRQGSARWCSAYSVDGEAFLHFLGAFSHTRQEVAKVDKPVVHRECGDGKANYWNIPDPGGNRIEAENRYKPARKPNLCSLRETPDGNPQMFYNSERL